LDHEYLLRLDQEDSLPEAIHQTRVAARRLRSDLQTFKAVLDPLWVSHTRSDLKWLGGELGLVRDADVLGQHLDLNGSPQMGDDKGVTGLREQLHDQRSAAADRVTDVLESERYLLLLDKLHEAVERPPFLNVGTGRGGGIRPYQRASKALPNVVKRPWKKLYRKVRVADREPTDRQLHQIRIGAKRLRYAAEAAEAVVGKRARRVAAAAEELQTQLGEHHDAVIAEAWLRGRAKGASSKVAFSAGILAAEQIRRQQLFREHWQARWEKVDRRAREWLG
jgi:CHAD domain-containing protein